MSNIKAEKLLNEYIPLLLNLSKEKRTSEIAKALLKLQRGLTGDKHLAGAGYMQDNAMLGAYLLYYWPVSFLQILTICNDAGERLEELYKKLSEEKRPLRILDLGCGPGAAACSVLSFLSSFAGDGKISAEVSLYDSGEKALKLAQKLVENQPHKKEIKVSASVCNLENGDFFNSIEGQKFDIVVMSHSLNELWKTAGNKVQRRIGFLEKLMSYLADCGLLIINEPSVLDTSRALLEVRDGLVKDGLHIAAPCCSEGMCPALTAGPNHTCHCENMWKPVEPVAGIARMAKLDRESVKMTCFVFEKEGRVVRNLEDEGSKSAASISGRIVSDGMLNKSGRIRFLLCDGKSRVSISAKDKEPHAREEGFFDLKRYTEVEIVNPEKRGDKENISWGIGAETSVKILRKPLEL